MSKKIHSSGSNTLADCGEERVLAALLRQLPPIADPDVLTGAGDDCAVIRQTRGRERLLLKTDCVIEGVHFSPETKPRQIGWKALCRPLSDIAAMGGLPKHALVTLAMPGHAPLKWAEDVYAGLGRAAREFGVSVVGGETARSPGPCFISVCLSGVVEANRCVPRGGGRVGDWLYVTGRLGGSFPSGRHLGFRPRLREARWLVSRHRIRAMMDLSDGLAADLPRLAAAGGTGFRLEREAVPRSPGCTLAQALGDGEDYELLFAVGPRAGSQLEQSWKNEFPNLRLTRIGCLAGINIQEGIGDVGGYQHFRPGA